MGCITAAGRDRTVGEGRRLLRQRAVIRLPRRSSAPPPGESSESQACRYLEYAHAHACPACLLLDPVACRFVHLKLQINRIMHVGVDSIDVLLQPDNYWLPSRSFGKSSSLAPGASSSASRSAILSSGNSAPSSSSSSSSSDLFGRAPPVRCAGGDGPPCLWEEEVLDGGPGRPFA